MVADYDWYKKQEWQHPQVAKLFEIWWKIDENESWIKEREKKEENINQQETLDIFKMFRCIPFVH